MIDPGLNGKTVLVTGGNHGIGATTARAFAGQGASVFIAYLRLLADQADFSGVSPDVPGQSLYTHQRVQPADTIVYQIHSTGGRAEAWEVDLADPAQVPRLFDQVEAAFGPVDVLVNNAAHWEADTFTPEVARVPSGFQTRPIRPETIYDHFAVNTRAVALTIAEFAFRHARHRKNWGRIINVSTDGAPSFPGEVSYGASKYAMESYSRAAAVELGKLGITINVISPGPVQTGWITPEFEAELAGQLPLRRVGQPEDIANAIVFLASEQAGWITGQVLHVGGGNFI